MKLEEDLSENIFIPIKNEDGGQRGNSYAGSVCHFLVEKQNTTINPKYRARCGMIISFYGYTVNKECKKCFNKK